MSKYVKVQIPEEFVPLDCDHCPFSYYNYEVDALVCIKADEVCYTTDKDYEPINNISLNNCYMSDADIVEES